MSVLDKVDRIRAVSPASIDNLRRVDLTPDLAPKTNQLKADWIQEWSSPRRIQEIFENTI